MSIPDTAHGTQAPVMEWAPLAIVRHERAHLDPIFAAKWWIGSGEPRRAGTWYLFDSVDRTCSCPAGRHGRDCRHAAAFDAWAPTVQGRARCVDCGSLDVRADSRCGPCAMTHWRAQDAAAREALTVRPMAGAGMRSLRDAFDPYELPKAVTP